MNICDERVQLAEGVVDVVERRRVVARVVRPALDDVYGRVCHCELAYFRVLL